MYFCSQPKNINFEDIIQKESDKLSSLWYCDQNQINRLKDLIDREYVKKKYFGHDRQIIEQTMNEKIELFVSAEKVNRIIMEKHKQIFTDKKYLFDKSCMTDLKNTISSKYIENYNKDDIEYIRDKVNYKIDLYIEEKMGKFVESEEFNKKIIEIYNKFNVTYITLGDDICFENLKNKIILKVTPPGITDQSICEKINRQVTTFLTEQKEEYPKLEPSTALLVASLAATAQCVIIGTYGFGNCLIFTVAMFYTSITYFPLAIFCMPLPFLPSIIGYIILSKKGIKK